MKPVFFILRKVKKIPDNDKVSEIFRNYNRIQLEMECPY